MTRARTVAAAAGEVWELVSDPYHLPRWWPDVVRVEDVDGRRLDERARDRRAGATMRADFTRVRAEPQRRIAWRQELEESPFERILSEAVTEVQLEPPARTRRAWR